jgi:uncharacterized damage-inducible protein DinB
MIHPARWFDRTFPFDSDPKTFPCVVERLRGTAARIADKLANLAREIVTERYEGRWSIQENVGHLADLEPLWLGGMEDIRAGRDELRPADLDNSATHQADHNSVAVDELLATFRSTRTTLVGMLDDLDEQGVVASAFHPRLRQPKRVIDLATFVADHDDHHLARMHQLAVRVGFGARPER